MYIRKGVESDFDRLIELYKDARLYMAETGNPDQWRDIWPPEDLIREDIKNGDNYVCVQEIGNGDRHPDENETVTGDRHPDKKEIIVGTFYLGKGIDPTYLKIYEGQWADDTKPYVVVHRITTDRNVRGAGRFILDYLYDKYGNVRIDTHKDNKPMQGLVNACGFKYCGIIYLETGEERIAFQKI